jgi:hypothetical protein
MALAVCPDLTHLAARARHPLRVPIDGKTREVKALARLRLPGRIHLDGANHFDPIVLLTAHEHVGIDIASIQQRLFLITGFSPVSCGAEPFRLAFLTVASFRILGRVEPLLSGGHIVRAAPPHLIIFHIVLLHPHAPQNLHSWEVLEVPVRKEALKKLAIRAQEWYSTFLC